MCIYSAFEMLSNPCYTGLLARFSGFKMTVVSAVSTLYQCVNPIL